MSFDVHLPARYVSLDILVTAMAKAVAREKRANGHTETSEAEVIAGAEIEWESRVRQLCDDRKLPGRDYDTYAKSDWLFLNFDRDLFGVNDLTACGPLADEGFTFRQVRDELEYESSMSDVVEIVNNDALINWEYWVERMPVLKAPDAARLMRGLDPVLYESLDATPTRNNVTSEVKAVKLIQRLAEAQERDIDTPEHWLAWARANKIAVHRGFEIAVNAMVAGKQPPEFVAEITPFRFEYAGYISHITQEQLAEEMAGIEARIASGKPRLADAAIALGRFLKTSAKDMLDRLTEEYFDGHLVVRDCQTAIPKPPRRDMRLRAWLDIVFNADMDKLLRERWDVPYTYSEAAGASSADNSALKPPALRAATTQPGVLKHSTRGRKRDELTPVIEAAQAKCNDRYDSAAVWNQLLAMAEAKHPPLKGYVPDEGIQYGSGDDLEYFTRKQLGDRIRRDRDRANTL